MIKRNKNSRKLHNALAEKRGFTIVEIVIAIAVIAILTAVIIPTYSYLVERANDAKLRERIDSIYKGFIASSDNFGKSNYVLIELDEEKYTYYREGKTDYKIYPSEEEILFELGPSMEYIFIYKDGRDELRRTLDQLGNQIFHQEPIVFSVQTESVTSYLNRELSYEGLGYNQSKLNDGDIRASLIPNGIRLTTRFEDANEIHILKETNVSGAWEEMLVDNVINQEYTVYNLIPGKEYRAEFTNATRDKIESYILKPTGTIRQINLESDLLGNNAYGQNVRDIGGWETVYGGKINYGLIYRGATISDYTSDKAEKTLKFMEVCNIYDIGSNYVNNHYRAEYYEEFNNKMIENKEINEYDEHVNSLNDNFIYNSIINNILQDKPVLISCENGVDKTGTICFMIEALLGLSEDDLAQEYELSTLSGNSKLAYVNDPSNDYINMLNKLKEVNGNTLQNKAYNWFKSIGFTEEVLDKFIVKMTNCDKNKIHQ